MSTTQDMSRRVQKLESQILGEDDGFTLEKVCRLLWESDRAAYLVEAEGNPVLRQFLQRFERKDAGRVESEGTTTP